MPKSERMGGGVGVCWCRAGYRFERHGCNGIIVKSKLICVYNDSREDWLIAAG